MKSLELTPDHRTRLLEMCEILFKEHSPFNLELEDQYDGSQYHIMFRHMEDNMFVIHWFEFCMTHLVEAIIATYVVNKDGEKVYKRTLNDSLSTFYLQTLLFSRGYDKQHPIDYLYNEFKKLNL